jgi:deoxyribodipyrimidine photo-lyase
MTRSSALQTLDAFIPKLREYQHERNYHDFSSRLSPFIRRRLISEAEVISKVLGSYSFEQSKKFIQEVCWRTYWKGWLENNKAVFAAYQSDTSDIPASVENANTGVPCLDAWIQKLKTTGFLHNHERMWFASIWIFYLGLPWQNGARFMLQHLLDGDPASNTLSWRWVAGLHTKGKCYIAQSDNIEKYTRGLYALPPDLKVISSGPEYVNYPKTLATNLESVNLPEANVGFLTGIDDLTPEILLAEPDIGVLSFDRDISVASQKFDKDAISDLISRNKNTKTVSSREELINWADRFQTIVVIKPAIGTYPNDLLKIIDALPQQKLLAIRFWDYELYPLATGGFFKFWEVAEGKITKQIEKMGCIKESYLYFKYKNIL